MKIKALAPWFGGKRNLAEQIINELGDHRAYWEPFCGSMAVLLAKPRCPMETVCDLHGDLTNLARVVQNDEGSVRLFSRLNRTAMSEALYFESVEELNSGPSSEFVMTAGSPHSAISINRAYHYMVVSWLGRNGLAGTAAKPSFCVRYTANGGHAATRWRSVVESLPDWWSRLRDVTILNRDAFEVINKIDDKEGTAIYVDPPYFEKGAAYVHDFLEDQHIELAGLLRRFQKAHVVVSYYDHPKLAEFYPDWRIRPLEAYKALSNAAKPGTRAAAPEVLLVNSSNPGRLW